MQARERLLVLGGNLPHKKVVEQLNALGYYTIVFDINDNPPAKEIANHFEQISITDKNAVLKGAQTLGVDQIINCCNDYAIPVTSFVSEKLGLPSSLSMDSALDCTDKIRMKNKFAANGIPSSSYQVLSSKTDQRIYLQFPIIVKPADSSGSKGISIVNDEKDVFSALEFAFSQCIFKQEVIVEEFIDGDEFQVDCVVQNGTTKIVLIKLKPKFHTKEFSSCVGSIISPILYKKYYKLFLSLAESIAMAFHIDNNTFFFQVIVNDQCPSVIELGVRVGGGWSYKMVKEITGCDILRFSLLSQLGLKETLVINPPQQFYNTIFLFAKKGIVNNVIGFETLNDNHIIESFQVLLKKGNSVDGRITNKNRAAIFMVCANSMKSLVGKIEQAIESVDILDINGESLFDRDLYTSFITRLNSGEMNA